MEFMRVEMCANIICLCVCCKKPCNPEDDIYYRSISSDNIFICKSCYNWIVNEINELPKQQLDAMCKYNEDSNH